MAKTLTKAVLKGKKPATKVVPILLDPERGDEWRAAKAAVEDARGDGKALKLAQERLDALRREIEDDLVEFKLQSIGRDPYNELIAAHPPTEEQLQQAGQPLMWNADTFPPAIVSACLVLEDDSDLTPEDIADLFNDPNWNQAELENLYLGALQVNAKNSVNDLGKDFAPMGA